MEYESIQDLPETIRSVLPPEAQKLYLEGYRQGWEDYDEAVAGGLDQDSIAHRQGWITVRQEFQQDEGTGKWHRRGKEESEEEKDEGLADKIKDLF